MIDHHTGKECIRRNTYLFDKITNRETSDQSVLNLPSGQYAFLAWIDYRVNPEQAFYDTSDLQRVTMIEQHGGEIMQAYAACMDVQVNEEQRQTVELSFYQPVSFYRFLMAEDMKKIVGTTLLLQYGAYYPITYNVMEGTVGQSGVFAQFPNHTPDTAHTE